MDDNEGEEDSINAFPFAAACAACAASAREVKGIPLIDFAEDEINVGVEIFENPEEVPRVKLEAGDKETDDDKEEVVDNGR